MWTYWVCSILAIDEIPKILWPFRPQQHGFRKGQPVVTAGNEFIQDVINSIKQGEYVVGICKFYSFLKCWHSETSSSIRSQIINNNLSALYNKTMQINCLVVYLRQIWLWLLDKILVADRLSLFHWERKFTWSYLKSDHRVVASCCVSQPNKGVGLWVPKPPINCIK